MRNLFKQTTNVLGLVLSLLFTIGAMCGGGQMAALQVAEHPAVKLPMLPFEQQQAINSLPAQTDLIIFQVYKDILVFKLDEGQLLRWQVRPTTAALAPLNQPYFKFHNVLLWPDGRFLSLWADRSGRYLSLSPTAPKVAYSTAKSPFKIYQQELAGGENTLLFDHAESPIWSPDGEKIAFYGRETAESTVGLYVAKADGTEIRLLIPFGYNKISILTPHLAWSPDSTMVAIVDNLSERSQSKLHALKLDGSERVLLFEEPNKQDRLEYPRWSPDGKQLAFLQIYEGRKDLFKLMVRDGKPISGQDKILLSEDVNQFVWSPDSKQLMIAKCLYGEERRCEYDLYLKQANGSQEKRLTNMNLSLSALQIPKTPQLYWYQ